ncbi:MAG TPA: rhomboid family intramembrane serine protease [Marmoricola sp.]|jgi:membrane associated rhomboid family serine protease|nr:rhomboid family intramembrane serine protease [Marmoricola sp.]
MRSAAVGFQCPECVREGARSTRQGRGPYGGRVAVNAQLVTLTLLGINVLVWLAIQATGGSRSRLVDVLAILPAGHCGAGGGGYYPSVPEAACHGLNLHWVPGVADGAWWQLLTAVFTHVAIVHIGVNMLTLWFLGPPLEAMLGRARFVAVYLVSGLTGSTAVMLFSDPHSQTLGASGAIFGLLGALLVVAIKVRGNVQVLLFWLAVNLVFTFTVSGISWQGHVGGLVGGMLLAGAMVYAPRTRRALVQWGSVALLTVAALAVVAARVAALSGPGGLTG